MLLVLTVLMQMLRIIQSLDITTTSMEVKMRSTVTNQSLNRTSQSFGDQETK